MAKFKKLALLCTALMMTASLAGFAACGDDKPSSSPTESTTSSDVGVSESTSPEDPSSSEDPSSPEDSSSSESNLPAADSEISIAKALEIGNELQGDTSVKYYVTGTIVSIANTQYGNLTIQDENGDSIYVYGLYNADGTVRYDGLENKPQVGDTVKLYSIVSYYNAPQLKNAWLVEHIDNSPEVNEPAADSVLSIPEAVALGEALKTDSQNKYYISGTITEIANTTYGNMYIEDENGNKIYVYGTYDATGANRYDAMENAPQVGDTVKLYSKVSYYNGAQLKNAWVVESTSYPTDDPQPEPPIVEEPEVIEEISILEAIALAEELQGTSENRYYVEGTIVAAKGANIVIADENGNEIAVYCAYDANGDKRYDEMENAPEVGKAIRLCTYVSYLNGAYLQDGCIVAVLEPVTPPAGESYSEEIISGESGSITTEEAWVDTFGTITFNVSEPGVYGIYAVDADFYASEVKFGAQGATDAWNEFATNYTFVVSEAGEVTLATTVNTWEPSTVEYYYYVYKMDTLVIDELGDGAATLAANLRAPIKVIAPAAGKYLLVSDISLVWFTDLSNEDSGEYTQTYTLTATEAGQEVDLYVCLDDLNYADFAFNYSLVEAPVYELQEGDNDVVVYAGTYMETTFTATKDGSYTMTVSGDYNFIAGVYGYDAEYDYWGWIESDYTNVFNFTAVAGETKTLHVYYNGYTLDYEQGPATVDAIVNISAFEEADPSALQLGTNTFTAEMTGTQATFTATEDGSYRINDGYNYAMIIDGEYYGEYEVALAAGESITFTVEYDGMITISVEKFTPAITLQEGANTITVPAEEAELVLDVEMNKPYTITWDNENVLIFVNGAPYESGTQYTPGYWDSFSIVTADGMVAENVVITVEAVSYPTLNDGDNAVEVGYAGSTYVYTATQPGTYVFTITGDITYAEAYADQAYDYPDSLTEAGAIAINVKAGATIELYMEAAETCNVSVNVACTSTINSFEMSVTMNAEGTAPESLTIASLKDQECAYFSVSRAVGDYILSWDADLYDNILVYAGDNVGMMYDPQVRLTRTMMDGIIYVVVRNNSGADLENIVINIAEYEEPSLNLGENSIDVESWGNVALNFTAEEDGEYLLSAAEGEENALIYIEYGYMSEEAVLPYSFTLMAGESIMFVIMTANYEADTVDLVLTKVESEPEVVVVSFATGMPTYVEIPAGGSAIMEAYIVGDFKVEWDPSVTNLVVYYGMQPVNNGDVITVASPRVPTQLTLTTSDGTALATRVMVSEYVVPPVELIVGNNAIDVVDAYKGATANFTASAAGTYVISAAAGEENAILLLASDYMTEMLDLPYTVTLEAGETISFLVATANYEADTINLVIAKEPDTLTVGEAIALGETFANDKYTTEKYYITGTLIEISNTTYGNSYIVDEEGNRIYIYGIYSADGNTKYGSLSNKPVVGDTIKVLSIVGKYSNAAQLKSAWLIEQNDTPNCAAKVIFSESALPIDTAVVTENKTITLPTSSYNDVAITWAVSDACASISGNALSITIPSETVTLVVTATISCETYSMTKTFEIIVSADSTKNPLLATFELGANGSASHNDGTEATTYSETVNGYTLKLTGGSKMYKGARDAKGNSCIKLGTSKVVGSFSFTVPEDVTKVIIYVAKYKANNTTIKINGTSYTLTNSSDNGQYDAIEVDTSSTKTVSFTTVASNYRAMINTIEFWTDIEEEPKEPVADEVDLELDTANNFTVMAGTYLVTAPIEVTGEYTYTWNVDAGYEVTVLINDVEIENGAKITYAEATEIVVTIKTSDITADINVSFVATKTPDDVVPDEEWTKNY